MRALSPKTLRDLRRYLCSLAEPDPEGNRLIDAIEAALKPKRAVVAAGKVRAKQRRTRKAVVSAIRAKVVTRAGDFCECGCLHFTVSAYGPGQMDHFHGGASRRALESVEGCWMLLPLCHSAKTSSIPSRKYWLKKFLRHSAICGYRAEPQRKAQAELESLELQGRNGAADV